MGFFGAEKTFCNKVHYFPKLLAFMVKVPWVISFGLQSVHFMRTQAENENIVVADFFPYFNVRAIHGADGYCPIERKFHVSGPRCLGAGG